MPYSKDPSNYPPEFAAIFQRAIRESFSINAGDRGTAVNLCHKLHAYRRAIECQKLEGWSSLRNTTIRAEGASVTFTCNEQLMASIREAVGFSQPSENELDKYLEQLEKGESNDGEDISTGHDVQQSLGGEPGIPSTTAQEEKEEKETHDERVSQEESPTN